MLAYASRTGTVRNLDALRSCGWGLMISATGVLRTEGFARYALDNGAWTAYQQGKPFDEEAFVRAVYRLGGGAQFVVLPDIVCGGLESLQLSKRWIPRLGDWIRRRLLPVQNGMEPADIRSLLGPNVGIFVGGDTAFKETTLPAWCDLAREVGCYVHVGRVNTARRIRLCQLAGADSFDGTSVTRFASTIWNLERARAQPPLPLHRRNVCPVP